MIEFGCTRCQKVFRVPDRAAGEKTMCPLCKQELIVPFPSDTVTDFTALVPAEPVKASSTVISTTPTAPAAQPVPADDPAPPGPPRPGERIRWGFWLNAVAGGILLLILCALGLRLLMTGGYLNEAGRVAEDRSQTRLPVEETVKQHIVAHAEKGHEAAFLTWGPHLLEDEVKELSREAGPGCLALLAAGHQLQDGEYPQIIRVRYSLTPGARAGTAADRRLNQEDSRVYDEVILVIGGKVASSDGNRWGGDWKVMLLGHLSHKFPLTAP
jgi:hypothetical protein